MSFQTELQSLLERYLSSYAAGDADGCAAVYHPDGRIDSPFGPPVRGRNAIRDAHVEWFLEGEENKTMDVLSAAAEGRLGYALLRYSADLPAGNGIPPRQEAGTNLSVLVRTADGWEILHSSLNPDFEEQGG